MFSEFGNPSHNASSTILPITRVQRFSQMAKDPKSSTQAHQLLTWLALHTTH